MIRREGELMLVGVVEMGESYVGGASKGKRGRGAEGKIPMAVMARQNESGGCSLAHMQVIQYASGLSLSEVAADYVAPGSILAIDGLHSYQPLARLGFDHQPLVSQGIEKSMELLPWVHIIISNFKRWILYVSHGVSAKHLQSYLDEYCYRFNRRSRRANLFRRALNLGVLFTQPVTYAHLTAS